MAPADHVALAAPISRRTGGAQRDPPFVLRRVRRVAPALRSLENGEVEARTPFLVYRSHMETDHQLLSACREDVLRNVNGAWKIARRTIVLDANVLLDENLSVFL